MSAGASIPIANPPILHSRPGSSNVLYLDFNGHIISGTRWNNQGGVPAYVARPYDIDGYPATFGEAEQAVIIQVWERVSEDFAAFDIDITTEEPAAFTRTTGRALVTPSVDANGASLPASGFGGAAQLDVFGDTDYATVSSPAFIYTRGNAGEIADAVSHEFGHNLGLSHDGRTGVEYYSGHGSGPTSWAPVMGIGYTRNLSQWSKGEYHDANNLQDDFAIIAGHLGIVPDDAGDTRAMAATPAFPAPAADSIALTGIISHPADSDLYAFATAAGPVHLAVATYQAAVGTRGGNLDVKLELLDAGGTVVALASPTDDPDASLTYEAAAGVYYVRLTPDGNGSPLASPPDGYTRYGSAGRYALSATIVPSAPAIISPVSTNATLGNAFAFPVKATNGPLSHYTASGLPVGLVIDSSTGAITGTPGLVGTFPITLQATNAVGSSSARLTLSVTHAPPSILGQTRGALLLAPGEATSFTVSTLELNGPYAYQWKHNGVVLPGATDPTLDLASVTRATTGYYQAVVTNPVGLIRSQAIFLSVVPASSQLVAWGANGNGHLFPPARIANPVSIAAGGAHTLALRRDRTVAAWGDNTHGQTNVPAGLAQVVALAAGTRHSLALKADGTVVAWGSNSSNQTALPAGLANIVAIAAGELHSLALRGDGTVVAWGNSAQPPALLASTPVTAIAAGANHCLALRADRTVAAWAWGANPGHLTALPAGLASVVAIAAGSSHSLALKADGTVAAWGLNTHGQSTVPAGLSGVVAIAAGASHSLALKADGTLVAWGSNTQGQALPPAEFSPFFAITAGGDRSYALHDPTGVRPPIISTHPLSRSVPETAAVTLTVVADAGTAPLFYQWRHNSVPIPGQTGASLILPSLGPAQTGDYDVMVSCRLGSVVSDPATVTLSSFLPVISAFSPARHAVLPGQPIALSVSATGTGPISCQWYHNSRPVIGASSPDYTPTTAASVAHSGAYWVVITDAVGIRRSPVSFVSVAPSATRVSIWGNNPDGVHNLPAGLDHTTMLSARSAHVLALQADGTLVAWGNNTYGQTNLPAGLGEIVSVAAGVRHSLALKSDGTVLAWGDSSQGKTTLPAGLADVIAIAAGDHHSLALKQDGTVAAWGSNTSGQTAVPAGLSGIVAIAAGGNHSLALRSDGTVLAWGSGSNGQHVVPSGLANAVAIAAGTYHSLALKADGTVVAWGNAPYATVPSDLNRVATIATGPTHSIAAKSDGTVVGWGLNPYGQTIPPAGLGGAFALAVGNSFSLAARDSTEDRIPTITAHPQNQSVAEGASITLGVVAEAGTAPISYQWRHNTVPLPGKTAATLYLPAITPAQAGDYDVVVTSPPGSVTSNPASVSLSSFKPVITSFSPPLLSVLLGQTLSLAATAYGTGPLSYQWYRNGRAIAGATGPTYEPGPASIPLAGAYWVVIANRLGTRRSPLAFVSVSPPTAVVSRWDSVFANLFPTKARTVMIAARNGNAFALQSDGTVEGTRGGPAVPSGLSGVAAIASGAAHALGLKSDGTVVAWGTNTLATTLPSGLSDVFAIATGSLHSLALKRDGTVVAWGNNTYGQTTVPSGLAGITAIAAGSSHSIAVKSDGTVVGWGDNTSGQTTMPAGLSDVVAVAAGVAHTLALKADGTVAAWGLNSLGQTTVPPGLSNVVAIAAGGGHSLALRSDGTVVAWGSNSFGQSTVPAGLSGVFAIAGGDSFSLVARAGVSKFPLQQGAYFTSAQIADPAVGSATADPDGDGLPNLLEYAFELNPTAPATAADLARLPAVTWVNGSLTLAYIRNKDASDLLYIVQISRDLVSWQSGSQWTKTVSTTPLDLAHEQVVVRDSSSATDTGPRFMRLLVRIASPQ